ncbi:hypothetical protein ONZ43_g4579 [Nemania bipapillata]|uniref:Uncharacterized protein n=1 Tax=Nemania bipapillata TaxID=110536 RepID=A0ACC2IL25_9PEZI|nr:hypothetical protein ONZ43_g4579 [Nemania bipapillata]
MPSKAEPSKTQATMASLTWGDELNGAKLKCCLTNQEYIRLDIIHDKITAKKVKKELPIPWYQRYPRFRGQHLNDKIYQARKVIAILTLALEKEHNELCVAIKQFRTPSCFYAELKSLEALKAVKNDHLTQHLATCEQARCIFFPWAHGGDLWAFWEGEYKGDPGEPTRTSDVYLWVLQQITGLAHALADIHGQGCRHGDLKPSNILHFTDGTSKLGTLKLADFGVSRIHEKSTGFRTKPTNTKASTLSYEAPEAFENYAEKPPRSRRYDCWSMGCIMLEFVIWLLYGFRGVTSFKMSRESPNYAYYQQISGSAARKSKMVDAVRIDPVVNDAIEALTSDLRFQNTSLKALVTIVQSKLLVIDPNDRLQAVDLHKALQGILENAPKDLASFAGAINPAIAVPAIFARPTLQHQTQATWEQY